MNQKQTMTKLSFKGKCVCKKVLFSNSKAKEIELRLFPEF